ncbi:MAG: hypothetical protein NZL93_00130 [Chthoniobacterales bacterium]|nr:hypothetical protein [Chthoniobacterales bacterium]
MAAAFHSGIRRKGGGKYRATLAWINDSPDAKRWLKTRLFVASRRRAEE